MTIKNISRLADELIEKIASVNTLGEDLKKIEDHVKQDVSTVNPMIKSLKRDAKKVKEKLKKQLEDVTTVRGKNFKVEGVPLDIPEVKEISKKVASMKKLAKLVRSLNNSSDISYQDVADYVKLFNK